MGNVFYSAVIYPLTQIIEFVFSFAKKLFDDTGIAVLCVSFAVSLLTLPLYVVAEHWQQIEREKQKSMKDEVQKIKAVFSGNERFMILATYYRQQHYHPIMSLRSAFGLLIQIPFFTAAYTCLSKMTALQGESFLFVRDMGRPDSLFYVGDFAVNVLPVAMTLINCVSGAIYTKGLGLRDKLQVFALALVFVCILYNSPAGLVMYWTMNNIFSLIKNVFYKLKHPLKTLYVIMCAAVSALLIWAFATRAISSSQLVIVAPVFILASYPVPLYVKLANRLIDGVFTPLRTSKKLRFALFSLSSLALCVLLGFTVPSLLIASSPLEFSGIDGYGNPLVFVFNTLAQSFGLCVVWPFLVYFLFRERIQTLAAVAFFAVLCCSLVNMFCFQGDYGTLSKLLQFTSVPNVVSPASQIALNLAVCLVIFAAAILALKFTQVAKAFSYVSALAFCALLCVSLVNVSKINSGYKHYESLSLSDDDSSAPIKPIFHLSKTGANVIFIFLDRAQSRLIEPIFDECPELYEQFEGFTFYKNTLAFNAHTLIGAPPCYGGYDYVPEEINKRSSETLVQKNDEALAVLPRVFTEQAEGFSAVVTDAEWAGYSFIPDLKCFEQYPQIKAHLTDAVYTDRWYNEHSDTAKITVTSTTLKRNLLWYGLFRLAPLALRPGLYHQGDYWSADEKSDDFNDYLNGYSVLDYLPELTDFESESENVFVSFSNNTTHDSLFLQAPDYVPAATVTNKGNSPLSESESFHSMTGAMKRLGEWFELLQNEGIYESTRIAIVADHGSSKFEDGFIWDSKFEKIGPGRYHPLLMFKDFGEQGKLKTSDAFMTTADVPSLLVQGIVPDARNPFTSREISATDAEAKKMQGVLVNTSNLFMPFHMTSKYVFTSKSDEWQRVKSNIFDSTNWTQETHETHE